MIHFSLVRGLMMDNPEAFSWCAHPARERPLVAWLASGIVLAAAWATGHWTGDSTDDGTGIAVGVLTVLVLVFSLRRFYFPSRFQLKADEIRSTSLFYSRRMSWSDVRRICFDQQGAYLSVRHRSSRLDAYQGMHLLFGDVREEVIQRLQLHWEAKSAEPPREVTRWQLLRTKTATWWRDAFAVDAPGPAIPSPEQQPAVDWVCIEIARRHLTTPGVMFLEMGRPLNYLAAQTMHAAQPALWAVASRQSLQDYTNFALFLERRGAIEYLTERIEFFAGEIQQVEESGQPVATYIRQHFARLRSTDTSPTSPSATIEAR